MFAAEPDRRRYRGRARCEIGLVEVGPGHVGVRQVGAGEVGLREIRTAQVGAAQIGI